MRIGIAAAPGGFELKVQLISGWANGSGAVLRKWLHWKKRRNLKMKKYIVYIPETRVGA